MLPAHFVLRGDNGATSAETEQNAISFLDALFAIVRLRADRIYVELHFAVEAPLPPAGASQAGLGVSM